MSQIKEERKDEKDEGVGGCIGASRAVCKKHPAKAKKG